MADKARDIQTFLVCAEARYIKYLLLLEQAAAKIGKFGKEGIYEFSLLMPLPPWYFHHSGSSDVR